MPRKCTIQGRKTSYLNNPLSLQDVNLARNRPKVKIDQRTLTRRRKRGWISFVRLGQPSSNWQRVVNGRGHVLEQVLYVSAIKTAYRYVLTNWQPMFYPQANLAPMARSRSLLAPGAPNAPGWRNYAGLPGWLGTSGRPQARYRDRPVSPGAATDESATALQAALRG
jgi:hypothetical protein